LAVPGAILVADLGEGLRGVVRIYQTGVVALSAIHQVLAVAGLAEGCGGFIISAGAVAVYAALHEVAERVILANPLHALP
jgi:hypothetical protein